MCIIFFDWQPHGGSHGYKLVLTSNRDEYFARPTRAAHEWGGTDIIAGSDLDSSRPEGGTWLGVTRSGRFAALTNYREPGDGVAAKGRGEICSSFLKSSLGAKEFLTQFAKQNHLSEYGGFSILTAKLNGAEPEMAFASNRREGPPIAVQPGIHGLCNRLLDDPWPKVTRGKTMLEELLKDGSVTKDKDSLIDRLLQLVRDKDRAPLDQLPQTGLPEIAEQALSPIYVNVPEVSYGTRSHAVLLVSNDNQVTFVEVTVDAKTQLPSNNVRFDFKLSDKVEV